MHAFSGSYALLASIPVWMLLAAILFIPFNVVWMGRGIIEGLEYNISWSSQQGDFALAIFICIGVSILQSGSITTALPNMWQYIPSFVGGLIVGVSISCYAILRWKDTVMDMYHNIVVLPLYVWLLGLTVPVVYLHGSSGQKIVGTLCLLVWIACFIFDWKTERLQQRHYLNKIGVCPWSPKWAKTTL